jgi:hypothetical protein
MNLLDKDMILIKFSPRFIDTSIYYPEAQKYQHLKLFARFEDESY